MFWASCILTMSGLLILWLGCVRYPPGWFKKDKLLGKLRWNSAAPAGATLIAIAISFFISGRSLELSKKQIVLQLRPFIGIIKPSFSFPFDAEGNRYWLKVRFFVHNFGKQPAYEYIRKNDKVMMISLSGERFQELEKTLNDSNSSTTERDVARQRVIDAQKAIIEQIYEYLRKKPETSYADINRVFGDKGVHCYGDIKERFPQPTFLLPEQTQENLSMRDVGPNDGQRIALGKEILVYYVSLSYEGGTVSEAFPVFFMGYYSELSEQVYRGQPRPNSEVRLREYKQWS